LEDSGLNMRGVIIIILFDVFINGVLRGDPLVLYISFIPDSQIHKATQITIYKIQYEDTGTITAGKKSLVVKKTTYKHSNVSETRRIPLFPLRSLSYQIR